MIDHNESPCDFPCDWIREETLSDIRLDGVSLIEAVALGCKIFGEAVVAYAAAVAKQDARLLAADPDASPVFDIMDMVVGLDLGSGRPSMIKPSYRPTQPRTLAVCNGPQFTVALIVRNNRLDVVDVGNA